MNHLDAVVETLAQARLKREGAFHPDIDFVLSQYRKDAVGDLAALSAKGYRVVKLVKVPEDTKVVHKVVHGAELRHVGFLGAQGEGSTATYAVE